MPAAKAENPFLEEGKKRIQEITSTVDGKAYLKWLEEYQTPADDKDFQIIIAELKLRTLRRIGSVLIGRKKDKATRPQRRTIPAKVKHSVIDRDEVCVVCGFDAYIILHTHHILPISKGGDCSEGNLVTLCPNCHAAAHKLREKKQTHELGHYFGILARRYTTDQILKLAELCN